MPLLPIAKGFYQRQDNSPTPLENLYFEADPTNLKDGASLITRPGMTPMHDTAQSFVAGLIRREDVDQTALCVAGTNAYIVAEDGLTAAGSGIAGTSRVRMATDGVNIMIVREGVLYAQTGTTVAPIEMPDDITVQDVVFLASRFWIATDFEGRVYFTLPGEVTVDALNYFSAENSPDPLVGLGLDGDTLVLLGRSSIEYWQPNADQDLPASRAEGRKSAVGCASVHSIVQTDAGLAWVGDDGIFYRSADLPAPIGDAGFAEMVRKARPDLDPLDITKTLFGWSFTLEQHIFAAWSVPGYGCFAYDFTTTQWCRFSSVERDLFAVSSAIKFKTGMWIVGGLYDGKLRYLTPDAETDDGVPIVRQFPAVIDVSAPVRCDTIQLDCTAGAASLVYPDDNPQIALRYSDDRGRTWSNWRYANLGQQGNYKLSPYWTRLGMMREPARVIEFRTSAALTFTVRSGRYNEPLFR